MHQILLSRCFREELENIGEGGLSWEGPRVLLSYMMRVYESVSLVDSQRMLVRWIHLFTITALICWLQTPGSVLDEFPNIIVLNVYTISCKICPYHSDPTWDTTAVWSCPVICSRWWDACRLNTRVKEWIGKQILCKLGSVCEGQVRFWGRKDAYERGCWKRLSREEGRFCLCWHQADHHSAREYIHERRWTDLKQ